MISLAKNLLIYESIKTTAHRAKAAKPLVEKLISLARANTLAAKRHAFRILGEHSLVSALFKNTGPRFKTQGGFTRIIRIGKRRGDDANMVIFELTEKKAKEAKKAKKEKKPAEEERKTEEIKLKAAEEKKPEVSTGALIKEKRRETKKPVKKFLSGLRNIFKKERDSL